MTRERMFRIFIIAVLAGAAISAADAAQPPASSLSPAAAALVRDIENNLIAPCCWNQPISEHPSEISDLMRAEVREMVSEGKNRDEILDYYVARYGERILAAPRARGVNVLAYAAPFAALILGGLGIFLFKGNKRALAPAAADPLPPPPHDDRYYDIIEKELKEFNE